MRKFSFAVLTGLALVGGADQSAIAATKTFYVGTCKPGKADFTTISRRRKSPCKTAAVSSTSAA